MLYFLKQLIWGISLLLIPLSLLLPALQAESLQVDLIFQDITNNQSIKELRENALSYLSLEQQKHHPHLSAKRIERLHQQAPAEIQQALQPFGYYQSTVQAQLIPPSSTQDKWRAVYTVIPGPPLILNKINIQLLGDAQQDPAFETLLAHLPIKTGKILHHSDYEKAKQQLRSLAQERGYFDAEFTQQQILIEKSTFTAHVQITLDSQHRYRFGEVTFNQSWLNDNVLQRHLTFKPGDFYTVNQMLALKNNLIGSDYFEQVDVERVLEAVTEDYRIPIQITLTPKKRSSYPFRIGYGTDTGIRGSLGWERRYVNRRGHRLKSKIEWSEIRQGAVANYLIPLGEFQEDNLTLSLSYRGENTDTSDSQLFKIGPSLYQARSIWGFDLREILGIEYRNEIYTIGTNEIGHSKLLMPHASWSYLEADDRINPQNGYKIQFDLRGAMNGLGSNTSFLQGRASLTVIRQLIEQGRLITRGEFGYSFISLLNGEFHDLPPSIRFFAGGDRSVRGYDYQALGPKNPRGEVIGGKHLLVGSVEYEHRIFKNWSVAAFYDLGNAFNEPSEPLKQGPGLGLRWHSPVGPIRIDIASAINERETPWRLHISVGPDL